MAKPSTQKYLNIGEIRENTMIVDDGSLRSVLLVSSINFALKNEDEQDAIIGAYVNFLNNLDFPLQILIQSREMNIDDYINTLKAKEHEQTNELLKAQTGEYVDFITQLISLGKIMNKRFYAIVPYNPISDGRKGFTTRLMEAFNPVRTIKMDEEKFSKLRHELDRRVDSIIAGLSDMGLNVVELDTQSLIELFYNTYNPVVAKNQQLTNVADLRIDQDVIK